jgi:hypothetical protein
MQVRATKTLPPARNIVLSNLERVASFGNPDACRDSV